MSDLSFIFLWSGGSSHSTSAFGVGVYAGHLATTSVPRPNTCIERYLLPLKNCVYVWEREGRFSAVRTRVWRWNTRRARAATDRRTGPTSRRDGRRRTRAHAQAQALPCVDRDVRTGSTVAEPIRSIARSRAWGRCQAGLSALRYIRRGINYSLRPMHIKAI